jgi:hypothetical protein
LVISISLLYDQFDNNSSALLTIRVLTAGASIILAILIDVIAFESFNEPIEKTHNTALSVPLFGLSLVGRRLISSGFDWGEPHDLSIEVDFIREDKFAPEVKVGRPHVRKHRHRELG